jgi:hypothetical protein
MDWHLGGSVGVYWEAAASSVWLAGIQTDIFTQCDVDSLFLAVLFDIRKND